MHKPLLTMLTAAVFLTACGTDEANADKNASSENVQSFKSTQSESPENTKLQDWSSLPEYNTVTEKIGGQAADFETVTDNPGKRILLLTSKDGSATYKTIFVKETKRLKIIHIDSEGLIFNDILKNL